MNWEWCLPAFPYSDKTKFSAGFCFIFSCMQCMSVCVWTGMQAMKDVATVKVAQVDCQAHKPLCQEENVRSYPTIRLYPHGRA